MNGLDKLGARRRRVTPPRRPARPPAVAAGAQPAGRRPADPDPAPDAATAPPPAAAPGAPLIAPGGATEQLGVRLHGYQIRRLRRLVHLLAEDEDVRRPTQAEVIQVLVDALPDESGPELTALAARVRDYRRRRID